ncbi:hypothetical protein I3843_15G155000 [Carya illinoinensis]|nr:hypothetical protein I3843_15G155000 [Carya illinoinensis]KAG7945499.1 hypothetical protein I3843_15G155000 [Carya illinoinensis]KAG7945500.1 hypothetical protein I3843_15G155000 [Carya illinoinensis]KAG7945501.1 hypothetical protein I3843_15G155000 [Carya illinoinensis]KAG7945502.1 hypothetical protein I3843_15G155000 [Carya illinoinensis]
MEDDHNVEQISKTSRQQSNASTSDAVHKENVDVGEELEDNNPNEDQRRMPRVQTHEQHRRLGITVPSQHASRINESTSDVVCPIVFGNIDYEEEDANFDIIGHKEAATKLGIVSKEAATFGIGGEEDDNPNEDLYENQRGTPRVQTREQRRRLGKTVPSQHASRIYESTSNAVCPPACGNIDHEEEDANFGITSHEEAVTKFGIVSKEVAAFGIGGEEDDYQNEERHQRVMTHEQRRKSAHKATFDIGEELEDDNPDEDRRCTPRVQTHEQRRRLGKTIPSQHASRINESTSDAVRPAVSRNIDQEEEDVNLGIIGHEEAATKFGIVPKETADFGIGEEEEEYQNEERRQRVLTHEQRRKSIRKAAFDIGEELEDDNLDEDQRRTPKVQTHEQSRRLGKTVPSQHASQIKESTSDVVRLTTFENIDHEEEDANFDIIGHEEAATKFGVVPKEAAAFDISEELEDDNPDEDRRRMPRVQTHEQRRRLGKTIPSQHASRINESTSGAVRLAVSRNIDQEEEDVNLGIIGHEEAATKFGIVPEKAADFGIGEEEEEYQNEERRQRVLTHEQRKKSIRKAAFDVGEELEDDNPDEDQRHMPRVQTHEQHRRLGKTVPSQHASQIKESTSDAVRSTAFENIDHEEEDVNFDIIGHEEAATKFGVVPKEAAAFGIGGEEDDNPNEDLYEDQRRMPRVQTREQRKRLGNTIPSQHASRINKSTSDAVCPPVSGNIDHEEEDANFGITGHEEAATKFGIVPNEASPFGIGGEEDDYQNEERHQRVLTHEQRRKSIRKAAFDIGEELEDDNLDEDVTRTPRVQTHEQRRSFGKTVPSQHASRINESTSDADFLAASGNIDQEEEDANFGISGHEEAATKFGIVPKEAAAFGIGEEENDYQNEERSQRLLTHDQRRKSGTIVAPECVIQINDNERQKPVIISGSGWSTLKVPTPMFEVDKGAYVPKIVSIGPFHYNEPSLRAMQTQKRRFLNRLIQNQTGQPVLEENLKNAMRELEGKTRDFYAEDFQAIKPDDFVQMMLLDGCFIVEMMRLYEKKYVGEPIFETRWTLLNISRNLLLLENQLPMFVLQKIFELTGEASPDLNMLALEFFEPLRLGKDEFATLKLNKYADEYIHLLALFHSTLTSDDNIYPKQLAKSEKNKTHLILPGKGWVHNAKTLRYAGIELKNNSGSILHIQLKGKTLNIPTMIIDDSIGPLLRNLIAYEQNNRSVAPYFCCLAVFLDSLVDTVEDVKILRDAGIIKQAKGGDKEVTNLFSSLTKELVFDIDKEDCYLIKQIENINRLCRAHDTRVQICRLLAKLNYKGLLKTYASILVTVIFSLIVAKFASYKPSVNQYYLPLSPPKQPG